MRRGYRRVYGDVSCLYVWYVSTIERCVFVVVSRRCANDALFIWRMYKAIKTDKFEMHNTMPETIEHTLDYSQWMGWMECMNRNWSIMWVIIQFHLNWKYLELGLAYGLWAGRIWIFIVECVLYFKKSPHITLI